MMTNSSAAYGVASNRAASGTSPGLDLKTGALSWALLGTNLAKYLPASVRALTAKMRKWEGER